MREAHLDRAGRWLYAQAEKLGDPQGLAAAGLSDEMLDGALAGVDALESVGALEAHSAMTDALVPPDLTDGAGTPYKPVSPRPVSSHGPGGLPDPDRPRTVTGHWRYQPAAPSDAASFTATLGNARWVLG